MNVGYFSPCGFVERFQDDVKCWTVGGVNW